MHKGLSHAFVLPFGCCNTCHRNAYVSCCSGIAFLVDTTTSTVVLLMCLLLLHTLPTIHSILSAQYQQLRCCGFSIRQLSRCSRATRLGHICLARALKIVAWISTPSPAASRFFGLLSLLLHSRCQEVPSVSLCMCFFFMDVSSYSRAVVSSPYGSISILKSQLLQITGDNSAP